MKLVMFTNIYTPLYAGIAKSIIRFREAYRHRGHEVLVVCPTFEDQPEEEEDVIRLPSLSHIGGTHYSLPIPFGKRLSQPLEDFAPDLVHAHHPFLLGDTALYAAAKRGLPLVYTHHTLYEHYTHYIPVDWSNTKDFLNRLVTGYCNLCGAVIAPSDSVRDLLTARGVTRPIHVVPTGVDLDAYRQGDGAAFRARFDLPAEAVLYGYAGRIRPEKSIRFLAEAMARVLRAEPKAWWILAGEGSEVEPAQAILEEAGVADRLRFLGVLDGSEMVDFYHALDAFVFASRSETQGMVLAEAMAAGRPVVALDGPGSRDILRDGVNGYLVGEADPEAFARAALKAAGPGRDSAAHWSEAARASVADLDFESCGERLLAVYEQVLADDESPTLIDKSDWSRLTEPLRVEWELWSGRFASLAEALVHGSEPDPPGKPAGE